MNVLNWIMVILWKISKGIKTFYNKLHNSNNVNVVDIREYLDEVTLEKSLSDM